VLASASYYGINSSSTAGKQILDYNCHTPCEHQKITVFTSIVYGYILRENNELVNYHLTKCQLKKYIFIKKKKTFSGGMDDTGDQQQQKIGIYLRSVQIYLAKQFSSRFQAYTYNSGKCSRTFGNGSNFKRFRPSSRRAAEKF
jgi:hypothetical protein